MIQITTTVAITLYLFLTLSVVLGVWLLQQYRSKKKQRLTLDKITVCEFCHFVYLERVEKAVTQCPQCHCYNKESN